jgi:aryl-alcohol dehydrogenase-like predicted oxidoreductase
MGYGRCLFECKSVRYDVDFQGVSEIIVGKAITKYKIPREKLVILTKCHAILNDDPYGGRTGPEAPNTKEYVNKHG